MISNAMLNALANDESGAAVVEYGLIAALMVIAMLSALVGLADSNGGLWGQVEGEGVAAMGN